MSNEKYNELNKLTFISLKVMAKNMYLPSRRSKKEYINDIIDAFKEYEEYKRYKIDKYKKIRKLGNEGKEGITYLVKNRRGKEFAMKTFKKHKSSNTLLLEYNYQKAVSKYGISPKVYEYDTVSKYIVMEKMDYHLSDTIKTNNGKLLIKYQRQIIDIFKKLDECGVFQGDSNILNYMLKDDKVYIIDFGFSKKINDKLCIKLNTKFPNLDIMTLGLILKLRELKCNSISWKYLKKHISDDNIKTFQIE